ncbi:hypothetical protein [Streptomyces albipurpureus]|uniref:Lipoprotein n=1 Tax=Streptomyces albipurpureus TaxID=2897419 RepID=A0ABT0UWT3_9ACTN|nr:hypothetical protein [Streptomyces sp. CWNU-1]MCM2392555.1 hypothetical protein [Streptomyces sp. CWNU-1]
MSVIPPRRLASAAGAALLTLTVAGCSGLGRTAVGPVSYDTAQDRHATIHSPLVRGCHKLASAGAVSVENGSLVDIVLYPTANCSGGDTIYVATMSSDVIAPGAAPWRSFRLIH